MNTTRKRLEGIARRLSALRALQQRRQPARPVVVRLDGIAPADRARVLAEAHARRDAEERRVGHSVALIVVDRQGIDPAGGPGAA